MIDICTAAIGITLANVAAVASLAAVWDPARLTGGLRDLLLRAAGVYRHGALPRPTASPKNTNPRFGSSCRTGGRYGLATQSKQARVLRIVFPRIL